ncbi:hypothetical protein QSH18_00870 [Xanthomonas sp. NCPPB 2654]|uniref:hypothetical protein n=2 Tax=Xanthomonas TaxID=338 RepID=UPI0021DF77AF|nr:MULTISPECIES: hypothetical protein [unclassified Xanthomonas]MDL5364152.1 hypothetical protein [Xanthomonas sp. NCPPB 2654]UYC20858.1 hypothetical protein NUG20_00650 [Xanthomonas sp. CFBP 8443]
MDPVSPNGYRPLPPRAGHRRVRCGAMVLAAALLAACAGAQPHSPSTTTAKERAMSEMTPEQLAQGVVRLILAIGGKQDLTPAQIAAHAGLQVDAGDSAQEFSASGPVAGGGRYSLESVADADGQPPSRLDFAFAPASAAPARCTQPLGAYKQALTEAGFAAQWIAPPRLGSPGRWHFERGAVVVYAFVGKDAAQDDLQACVSALQILATA